MSGFIIYEKFGPVFDRKRQCTLTSFTQRAGRQHLDYTTGRPPAIDPDFRAAWVQAREEAALERLLGGAP